MLQWWYRLFLEERPSISLSFFRIALALTTGFHVLPSFCHLADNYFHTAFKTLNYSFFPSAIINLVQKSPDSLVVVFVALFCLSWFFFLIGWRCQISCIVMTVCCYYFYALNAFPIGTLSWDILLVTLFLMCAAPYHGDYFSMDCLLRGDEASYQRRRPFFVQRLLQLQIGFTYFYTALYKVTGKGNWLTDNPLYYLMHYPEAGVTKHFLLRDYMIHQPLLCYGLGILIVVFEFSMIFLLFDPRTRRSAIYAGIFFHVLLILTLDVPAIFFFLFPAQLLLFIPPDNIIQWIEKRRRERQALPQPVLLFDGQCQFCVRSVERLKIMDLFAVLKGVDLHQVQDLQSLHPSLTKETAMSQLHLIVPGVDRNHITEKEVSLMKPKLYGGFEAIRRMSLWMPMMYPLIPVFYFPGMGLIGSVVYRLIAQNRYLFHFNRVCKDHACYR